MKNEDETSAEEPFPPEYRGNIERDHQAQREYEQSRQREWFDASCPPLYKRTDPNKLSPDLLKSTLSWSHGPKGLILVGRSGTGKTRCAWQLIHRLTVQEGRKVLYFDGLKWGLEVSSAFSEPQTTESWLAPVCNVEILFIDDLFKAKFTEAQEQGICTVFERRTAYLKPIIATTNTTGEMLLARMTEQGRAERGEPLIRRMREFCQIIQF